MTTGDPTGEGPGGDRLASGERPASGEPAVSGGPAVGGEPAATGRELAAMGAVAGAWAVLAVKALPVAARLAPMAVQKAISWTAFRSLTQAAVLAAGLGAWLALVPGGRRRLGLRAPAGRSLLAAAAASPVVWTGAAWVGLAVALPTLMEELRTRGPGASRQNAGPLAAELTGASLPALLLAGVVLAALAEECLFRGAIWASVQGLVGRLVAPPAAGDDALPSPGDGARRWARAGAVATVASALLFGAMHADVPGGVGLVRVVSTTCLGLAAGAARTLTGSLWAAVLLHALHNTLSLGQSRGWFAGLGPVVYGVPAPVLLAAAAALAWAAVARARRHTAARSQPAEQMP